MAGDGYMGNALVKGEGVSQQFTKEEVEEVIIQMVLYIGFPQTLNAMKVAREVFKEAGLE